MILKGIVQPMKNLKHLILSSEKIYKKTKKKTLRLRAGLNNLIGRKHNMNDLFIAVSFLDNKVNESIPNL